MSASKTTVCLALDFETSGTYEGAACAIGMVRLETCKIVDSFYSLIRPPSSHVKFTGIHGLTWNILKNEPDFPAVWKGAAHILAGIDYFIAHNAAFDRGVLYSCRSFFNLDIPDRPFLCTLKGARKALDIPSKKLSAVCAHLGIKLVHHHAGSDAMACARIYQYLRNSGIPDEIMSLEH